MASIRLLIIYYFGAIYILILIIIIGLLYYTDSIIDHVPIINIGGFTDVQLPYNITIMI